jgi:hypothetical protein
MPSPGHHGLARCSTLGLSVADTRTVCLGCRSDLPTLPVISCIACW